MTSLLQDPQTVQDQDPSEWPAWTDDYTWECNDDPDEWDAACALFRREGDGGAGAPDRPGPTPLRAADLPAVQWFACQVAWQRSQSREDLDYHDLVATALNDVLCVLRDRKCPTAAALVALPGTIFKGVDLAAVKVPDEPRTSSLAGCQLS